MNKYLISADIEGITGVVNKEFADHNGKYYPLACRYMVSDVNAVVRGILNADSDAWILVRDAHETATNLDLEKLHPRANLLQGWGPGMNMVAGLDQTFKGVFLVGYHAGGNNRSAVLGHTMSGIIEQIKVNDKLVNEAGTSAIFAGYYGVPTAFISGDDEAVREAKQQLGEAIIGAVVKRSVARDSVMSLPLKEASALLEQSAEAAALKLLRDEFPVYQVTNPVTMEIKFFDNGFRISVFKHLAEILRFDKNYQFNFDNLTVSFVSQDALEMLQRLNMLFFLVFGIKLVS